MATYTRLGTFILGGELLTDPIGKVHRGLTITGSRFDRHKLVRVFSDEVVEAGIGTRMEEAGKVSAQLAGTRGFASGYQCLGGKTPHVACDHLGGRSLAALLRKAKQEQIPLGVDHALSVIQGISQSLALLHSKGYTHGVLSPHSAWLTFEGATHLVDAPYASALQSLLPKCPILAKQLEAYRPSQGATAQQLDFYALGAILFELLTFDTPPAKAQAAEAIANATLKAAQEDGGIPAELQGLLRRLLMVENPYESAGAFVADLESVLYDGDYSPTTFNMAFFMHTLFREENEADTNAMKADVVADYTPLMEDIANAHKMDSMDTQKMVRFGLIGGGLVAILLGGFFIKSYQDGKRVSELTALVAKMKEEGENAKLEREKGTQESARLAAEMAKNAEEAKKGNKEAIKKQEELTKQKAEVDKKVQEATAKEQQAKATIAQVTQKAPEVAKQVAQQPAPQPTPQQPAPQPAVQPAVQPPQPVAQPPQQLPPTVPQQAAPPTVAPAATTQQSASNVVEETAGEVIQRQAPTMPPQANMRLKSMPPGKSWSVRVQVYVDANGQPQRTTIAQDSGVDWGFEKAAQDAAMSSKFKPATRNGKPISGWISISYSFSKK